MTSLFVRLEAALVAIEQRQRADAATAASERARLQRIEAAAADAVRALDHLIGQA